MGEKGVLLVTLLGNCRGAKIKKIIQREKSMEKFFLSCFSFALDWKPKQQQSKEIKHAYK